MQLREPCYLSWLRSRFANKEFVDLIHVRNISCYFLFMYVYYYFILLLTYLVFLVYMKTFIQKDSTEKSFIPDLSGIQPFHSCDCWTLPFFRFIYEGNLKTHAGCHTQPQTSGARSLLRVSQVYAIAQQLAAGYYPAVGAAGSKRS